MTDRVLVAGGTGRLGRLVVGDLNARGIHVRVLTRDPRRAAQLRSEHLEVIVGDVRDPASVRRAAGGVELVVSAVHGFAGPGRGSPATVDRDGNVNLISAAHASGAGFVLVSGVGAAADSPFELFRMKYAAERALVSSGVPATIVRPTAFLELWIDLINRTLSRSGAAVVLGHGENPINFVSVRDVAALVVRVVTDNAHGQTVEIGGPDNLTMNGLARLVASNHGSFRAPRHVPRPVLEVLARSLGLFRPEVGRQIRAALLMDRLPLSFPARADVQFAGLPNTSVAELLPTS